MHSLRLIESHGLCPHIYSYNEHMQIWFLFNGCRHMALRYRCLRVLMRLRGCVALDCSSMPARWRYYGAPRVVDINSHTYPHGLASTTSHVPTPLCFGNLYHCDTRFKDRVDVRCNTQAYVGMFHGSTVVTGRVIGCTTSMPC